MANDVTVHDLEAIGDIADWLCEQSDGMPPNQAIELLEGALVVQAKLKLAIDMLRTQALNSIEQPILIGRIAYSKKPSIKKRPNLTKIAARVSDLASRPPDVTGESPTAYDAAVSAVGMMIALYVSPSTEPKVGGVKAIGYTVDEVTTEDRTGWELKRTELD